MEDLKRLSTKEIAQIFNDYVERMDNLERHTETACKEVDVFDQCCCKEFPEDVKLQTIMYDKMMGCAVEFEESGFIAGFKTAMALIFGDDELLPKPTQIPTPKAEKSPHRAISNQKRHSIVKKFIDSLFPTGKSETYA